VPAYASASISIIMSGCASLRTSTTVDAGGESARILVRASHFCETAHVGDEHPRANHVNASRARAVERRSIIDHRLARLHVHLSCADDHPALVGSGGARDCDHVAGPHQARIADDRLPRRVVEIREIALIVVSSPRAKSVGARNLHRDVAAGKGFFEFPRHRCIAGRPAVRRHQPVANSRERRQTRRGRSELRTMSSSCSTTKEL